MICIHCEALVLCESYVYWSQSYVYWSQSCVYWSQSCVYSRSVLESLVEFVLRQEHEVGVMLCVQKMLDKLYHSFKLLQSDPVLWLLLHRLLGK